MIIYLGIQQLIFNQVLLAICLKIRCVTVKLFKPINDRPLSGNEDRYAKRWFWATLLINAGLTLWKLGTSGPYTVRWIVMLPLLLEVFVPIMIWGILIQTIIRMKNVADELSFKFNRLPVALLCVALFAWTFVTLIWIFPLLGYAFPNGVYALFVWNVLCIALVTVMQLCTLFVILNLILNQRAHDMRLAKTQSNSAH